MRPRLCCPPNFPYGERRVLPKLLLRTLAGAAVKFAVTPAGAFLFGRRRKRDSGQRSRGQRHGAARLAVRDGFRPSELDLAEVSASSRDVPGGRAGPAGTGWCGKRAMFRDHARGHDHGTSPRSGHVQVSVITPWLMITEHRPVPGARVPGPQPLPAHPRPSNSPTHGTWVRLLWSEAGLAGGFSGPCRRVSASRRVDRTIRRQPSFMRQRSFRNPETLPAKDENPPGHGNSPPGARKPSRKQQQPAGSLRKSPTHGTLLAQEPHPWDIDGVA